MDVATERQLELPPKQLVAVSNQLPDGTPSGDAPNAEHALVTHRVPGISGGQISQFWASWSRHTIDTTGDRAAVTSGPRTAPGGVTERSDQPGSGI
jgi:hypothetical protein